MPSPFPGMDPYIEELNWRDFHNSFAYKLRADINAKLPAELYASLESTVVIEQRNNVLKYYRPDIAVDETNPPTSPMRVEEPMTPYGSSVITATPPTMTTVEDMEEWELPYIEIKELQSGRLVLAVEILSPVNKKNPNLEAYRKKRLAYFSAGVHLLEIDLLRSGKRPVYLNKWPACTYCIQLIDAIKRETNLWALGLSDSLPIVSLPLLPEMTPVLVDLQRTLDNIYDESMYGKALNYSQLLKSPLKREADQAYFKKYGFPR